MNELIKHFPAIKDYTYLNTPAIGLISRAVYEFRRSQQEKLLKKGSLYMQENGQLNAQVREEIASFFNAKPELVALFPAFSYGLNALLEGLEHSSKILLLKNDYPSINAAVEARDFDISYVEIDADLESRIRDAFKKNQPDAFVFSQVQYLNGIKVDFEFIKTLKKEFPDTLFIGDGTQYLGTEAFDFENSGIDALGASAYKWLGAGLGNGFFMFRPGLEDKIKPKHLGFASTMGKYKEQGNTFIGKFEGNHLDGSNIGSIKIALEFQEKIGKTTIEYRINNLIKKAKTALTDLNLLEESVVKRKEHSSIFNIKGDDALFEKLTNENILCTQRGEGIRIGFHYYNTEEDLETLLDIIKKINKVGI